LNLKIDLHVHSYYSYDSLISPKELVYYAKRSGLDGVAVTDHDRLDSAVAIAKETDFFIVPGMEVTSRQGHIVALNVRETIPKGLTADETIDRIHHAGGIALACHPTALFKGSLGKHTNASFDAIEVINSAAVPFRYSVRQAQKLACLYAKPQVAGTDAHYGPQIGYAYTVVDAEPQVDAVIKSIQKGLTRPEGTAIPWRLRLRKEIIFAAQRLIPMSPMKREKGTQ
jgi:predicted metal-dependent phosphoesterase TrpH